jgi:hypothetical protein
MGNSSSDFVIKEKAEMATLAEKRQRFIKYFREQTGAKEWTMRNVAEMAQKMGWPLPKPEDPLDILAKQFSDAAREEIRTDKATRKRYKANLAYTRKLASGKQLWLWFDVDDATREQMVKGLHLYREQMVGEAEIGVNTADHWNRNNPDQQTLPFETDLTPDVMERASTSAKKVS